MVSSQREISASSTAVALRSTPYTWCSAMKALTRCSSAGVRVGVDPLPEFGLAAAQVLLGQLPDGLDGERAGPEGRLADRQPEDLARPSWCARPGRAVRPAPGTR